MTEKLENLIRITVKAEETEAARKLFPKMPREVFDLWIVPGIEFHGWPFTSIGENTVGTKWEGFFGCYPMNFWGDAIWKLLSIPTKKHIFHLETEARILTIIGNAQGVQTPMTGLYRTVERFEGA
jgi:hypothetical protein